MEITCHTNLDVYMEEWPKTLPCRPMVGDFITSQTGLELRVVRVTFSEIKPPPFKDLGGYHQCMPPYEVTTICDVELHLPQHRFQNISDFEKWYKNRRKDL